MWRPIVFLSSLKASQQAILPDAQDELKFPSQSMKQTEFSLYGARLCPIGTVAARFDRTDLPARFPQRKCCDWCKHTAALQTHRENR